MLSSSTLEGADIPGTVFENYIKSLIKHCERGELRFHFEWTKVNLMPKNGQFVFENLKFAVKQCHQTF